jgi:hypothetical protein
MTAETPPRSGDSCQSVTASTPATVSALSESTSELEPGKVTTPIFTAPGARRHRRVSLEQLDGVGLDERVAQQLFGEAVDDGAGLRLRVGGHGQLDAPADPDPRRW